MKIVNEPVTLKELDTVFKSINIKSAAGSDKIHFIFFKYSPELTKNYLLQIFDKSRLQNDIPTNWKYAIVKPILKPGKNKNDLNSYRSIALTNTTSKIIEKLIVNRITWCLEKNMLINPSQADFRKAMCTTDSIIRLHQEADFALNSGFVTVAFLFIILLIYY